MAKKNQQDLQNVDKRLVERLAARGDFSHDELKAALDKLPDLSDQAEDIAGSVYGEANGE